MQKSQLHVNQLLSNISVQYSNAEYIWDKVFPIVNVMKDSDLYRVYDRNFKMPESKRAPKGVAHEFSFDVSSSSYVLNQNALKEYVGVDEAENYDQESLQVDTTEFLTDAIYRSLEKSVADLFVKANWSLNVSLSSSQMFTLNTVTTDPVPVFDTGASTVISNSGRVPNFGIVPRNSFIAIKNHMSVLDRVKYTSAEVSEAMVGALLGLPEMLVPMAIQDTAAEGLAASTSLFFDDFCFMGWKPGSPGRKQPSCGYMFVRSSPRVRSWFDNERNATAIEVEIKSIPKVIASLTGYLIGNTQ